MGLELILLSYAPGLVLLLSGVSIIVVGRIVLGVRSRPPIQGLEARAWGLLCVVLAVSWFLAVTWAWGKFTRV
ncbi:hypothetical protein AB1L88_10245 [Tautonia sp. JC769]|uniref:hypothetical protein n=1 Tax=Tautonia sp. JC769 TaxID=3232135 RepID=UPI003459E703